MKSITEKNGGLSSNRLSQEQIGAEFSTRICDLESHINRDEKETVRVKEGISDVQFFFNETKSKDEVSRFWLWDSHRENPVGDVEKRLPYLPQDRRSRSDPYLGIPPR